MRKPILLQVTSEMEIHRVSKQLAISETCCKDRPGPVRSRQSYFAINVRKFQELMNNRSALNHVLKNGFENIKRWHQISEDYRPEVFFHSPVDADVVVCSSE